MSLKAYVPVSILFFVAVLLGVHYFGLPVIPFAVVLLVGETFLGFQLEDEKLAHNVSDFVHELKPKNHDHA